MSKPCKQWFHPKYLIVTKELIISVQSAILFSMRKIDLFKTNEETELFINEVSALTGYGRNVVKEVLEFLLMNWAIKIVDNPDKDANLTIPYLGNLAVKYESDEEMPNGTLSTNIKAEFTPASSFKQLVGVLHDEGHTEIETLMKKKCNQTVMIVCNPE